MTERRGRNKIMKSNKPEICGWLKGGERHEQERRGERDDDDDCVTRDTRVGGPHQTHTLNK